MIDVSDLTRDGGRIRGNPGLDQLPIDQLQPIIVLFLGGFWHGEVEPLGAVELGLDEAGSEDAATEVDDLVGGDVVVVEGLLVLEDLAGQGIDPEVLVDELSALAETAVGELGDAGGEGDVVNR